MDAPTLRHIGQRETCCGSTAVMTATDAGSTGWSSSEERLSLLLACGHFLLHPLIALHIAQRQIIGLPNHYNHGFHPFESGLAPTRHKLHCTTSGMASVKL
jgi:hypothetical protein